MRTCLHIFRHELRKILTDKKMLASMFLMPVLMVGLMAFLMPVMEGPDDPAETKHIYVLRQALPRQALGEGVELTPVEEDCWEDLELNPGDVVLDLGESGAVLYYHGADAYSSQLMGLAKQLLRDGVLASFAAAHGVDRTCLVRVVDRSSGAGNSVAAILLPYLLVLMLVQDTTGFAVETIAGEKDRGVFAKTLLAPVSPMPVLTGKILSSTVCGILSCGAYFLVLSLSSQVSGLDVMGLGEASFTPAMLILLGLCALLLSCFFANLAVLCALYARTAKEAKAMRLPLFGLVLVTAIASMFRSGPAEAWHYWIPVYNLCIAMQDILRDTVTTGNLLAASGSLALASAAVITVSVLSFRKESVRY